jgi:hypothetical protein
VKEFCNQQENKKGKKKEGEGTTKKNKKEERRKTFIYNIQGTNMWCKVDLYCLVHI